ncbi:Stp1/IreP family PP2C-type Ser/Thr phosphatase [Rubrobacter indicoceani]|uniref:Stp1/IreP family PP2C-type Ser/Thr phosphatase n=1 Tax=Rubrobacter indicoceani TaxID=2051957 RepID=UPI000E5A4B6E|nr:Stp1/IreP family PP2C-type Ser/Thr phosphatase [Rubrobacter indicoceani]
MFYLEHFGLTDPGKVRENNEDSLLVGEGADETLFAVADGIGGFEAGEVASRMTVDVLKKMSPEDSFEDAIKEANRRIRTASKGDERLGGMGTTVVAIRFGGTRRRPVAEVAHVGDSRAYLMRGDKFRPLTEDHSLVAELVRSGEISREEAAEHPQKNLITRALGAEEKVETDTSIIPIEADDRILLCSDGLSDMVREDRIRQVLLENLQDPETPANILLSEALEAGGTDNVTAVIVDVRERRDDPPERGNGTREIPTVGATVAGTQGVKRGRRSEREPDKAKPGAARRPGSRRGTFFGRLVRGAAVLALLLLALTPVYAWGSSRYFLDEAADGEVVVYRGLPMTILGFSLSGQDRATGVNIENVNESSRAPILENTLYTEEDLNAVVTQLESDAEQNRREAEEQAEARQREQQQNEQRERRQDQQGGVN